MAAVIDHRETHIVNSIDAQSDVSSTIPLNMSIALAPCDLERGPNLLSEMNSLGEAVTNNDRDTRLQLLAKARSLVRALETPRETMIKHCWAQPSSMAALSFGVDTGLWIKMLENGDGPQKASDLAIELGIEPTVLQRLMKHIGAMGYITETGPGEYKMNNFTKAMTIPVIGNGYPVVLWSCNPAVIHMHEFLKKTGYKTPTNMFDGVYQSAHQTELNFFAHMQANPPHGEYFNDHMGGYRQGRPSWMDRGFYPVQDRLIDGFDATSKDAALIVDIGGNVGHDLEEFRIKIPDAPGRLVLQDLPIVIGQIKDLNSRIERMPHDFLEEQPVKSARAYYMHSCLHDWPDDFCMKIVERVKEAMKPGYSKLLINENVIPNTGADSEATGLDILMMSLLSSRERTELDWTNLLETMCGLKIVKIWTTANGVESIIECELP